MGSWLFKSKLFGKFIIYSSVNPSTITWFKITNYVNTVCVKSLSILDLQEQILLSMSAEKYSDPTNREKLSKMNKKKGIKEILVNTDVDKINKKVSVKCLYEEDKLPNHGENYFGLQKEPLHSIPRSTQNLRLLERWTCISRSRWTTRIMSLSTSRKQVKKIISFILWVIILWFHPLVRQPRL